MATPLTLCNYFLTEQNVKNFSRVSPVNGCIPKGYALQWLDVHTKHNAAVHSTNVSTVHTTRLWRANAYSTKYPGQPGVWASPWVWVWSGYGDRNSVPTAALKISHDNLPLSHDNAELMIDLRWTPNLPNILRRTQGFSQAGFFFCKIARSSEIVFEYPHTIFLREILARSKSLS